MKIIKRLLPAILIAILAYTLIFESFSDSPTYDEPANMAASYDYVYRNDFRIYPDNPPFVKILAGLALFPIKNQIKFNASDPSYKDPGMFNLYAFGTDFLYKSGNDARKIIFLTRLPNIIFTIALGIILYLFAKSLFGANSALFALTLYAFDPNLRGHGHILAFDIPLSFFITGSLYIFYKYYKSALVFRSTNYKLMFAVSVFFTLGFLTKFTFIFFAFFFSSGLILLGYKNKKFGLKRSAVFIVCVFSVPFLLLWLFAATTGYNSNKFNYNEVPIIKTANKTLAHSTVWNLMKILPVPNYYKTGMMVMETHNIVSQPAYLLGEVREKNDWFFYFPISFMLKTPIPTIVFILLSFIVVLKKLLSGKKLLLRNHLHFIFGGLFFFSMMLFSHINNVYRYLFPSLILFLLGSSQLAIILDFKKLKTKVFLFSFIFYLFITSLFSFPLDLSYTNELTGIPPQGYKYLSDSEIDWGQDLERLARYLKSNNMMSNTITLSYLGTADPEYYGIKYKPMQFTDLDKLEGTVVISIGNLTLGDWMVKSSDDYKLGFIKTAPLDNLRNIKPDKIIGKSIWIYKI